MRRSLLACAVVTCLAANAARADEPPHRRPGKALRLSIGVPLLGAGITALGLGVQSDGVAAAGAIVFVLGPSAGHVYAGEFLTTGLGIRLAGAALFTLGAAQSFRCSPDLCQAPGYSTPAIFAGMGVLAVGTIWDIVTAPGAADDYNARHAMAVTPTALRDARGGVAPGLAFSVAF
jgi:hypothetical protein